MLRNFLADLKDVSPACREYFLKADSLLSALAIGISAAVIPPTAVLDYLYYGFTEKFFATVLFEGVFVALCLLAMVAVRHAHTVAVYDWAVFIWTFMAAIGFSIMGFDQPERVTENILVVVIFTTVIYTLVTNRLLFRLIPAWMMMISYLVIFGSDLPTAIIPQQEIFFSASLLVVNIGGLLIVGSSNRHKQDDYQARQSEKEARQQLETLASIDPLTNIFNRRHFMEIFNHELDRGKRYGARFSLVLMDLDHFKQVNDTYGHLAGDEALKAFVRIIQENKRKTDIFGRLGGEEFGLLMMETSGADALTTLQRFLSKARQEHIVMDDSTFHFTFSAGITETLPKDRSIDEIIHRADEALYKAKESGRNHCVLV
ncbi:MAG TPA: GGDEF domain-containing protein [Anaerolineales bacterium]|nr:GGDEF domain-containing protein [Anaerolineales bacterium]HNC88648.1 GGDEF domain-containing protein [Anaerolineales bacterium]HND91342.1 GGDEF domain-containing protein [Anaerolineales bacterium]HNJ15264.1 GGDEF domain-containing protein [Anaerolineales bacterium]